MALMVVCEVEEVNETLAHYGASHRLVAVIKTEQWTTTYPDGETYPVRHCLDMRELYFELR